MLSFRSVSTLTAGLRPWQLLLLPVACAVCCSGVVGFAASLASSYADGPGSGNNYTATWLAGWGLVLGIQAACVVLSPGVAAGSPGSSRSSVWRCFSLWMFSCGVILLVCLGLALPKQSGWAVLWLVGASITFAAVRQHAHQQRLLPQDAPPSGFVPAADEEASAAPAPSAEQPVPTAPAGAKVRLPLQASVLPPGSSSQADVRRRRARWQRCCAGCGGCMAWSSLFWAAVLGLFLVLQAGSLASDQQRFPPPGVLVDVPITLAGGGGTTTVKLHLSCAGPITPGLSTFVLEAGGGAPGISLAGIRDGLAAGGRRACFYDRLGYGWSDDAFTPTTRNRSTEALWGLLAAAPASMAAPPPFILVGHSAGGQLALQFAASHPDDVAGVALLDSYSDVAIALRMLTANATLPLHTVMAPSGSLVSLPNAGLFYSSTVPLLDLLRAVTPLAWARWMTAGGRSGAYAAATSAAYGNNKEWHAQWVEVLGMAGASGGTVADTLTLANGGQAVWRGAGWPDLSPRPVLLMPAAQTLALPAGACPASGTDFSLSTTCVAAVQAPGAPPELVYADLYLAYAATLSFNASLFAVPGSHSFPWETPQVAVEQLLLKFDGV